MPEAASSTGSVGERYAARMARVAATGVDMHGEATFCAGLVGAGARVLDAGCGTGRVAARLAELGYACTGVDVDSSMIEVARRTSGVRWCVADLATLDLSNAPGPANPGRAPAGEAFELVVVAGNVFPLLATGTGPAVVGRLAAHLAPGAPLVAGFGLDRAHLPPDAALVPLGDYDAWCAAAGLALDARYATWDGSPFDDGGYAVSVHRPYPEG